jgi:tripartite-type tricarboxylate transporter receptor subunit TctC
LGADEVRAALKRQGTDPAGGTPAEFATFIRADIEKWTAVLAASGPRK